MVYAVFVVMLALAGLLLLLGVAASEGAADGLRLFAGEVLPCLFPFMVCGRYLINSGVLSKRGTRKHAIAEGFLQWSVCAVCGTPSAAMICSTKHEEYGARRASMLCAALNQMNPAFVTGLLASKLLGAPRYGLMLALSQYLPACISAVVISSFCVKELPPLPRETKTESASALFARSLSEACGGVLQIGGTIVFFRVMIAVCIESGLLKGSSSGACAVVSGIFEMTNGLALLSGAMPPGVMRVCICAGLLSFGGICVFVQSKLFYPELSAPWYFIVKLIHGAVSFGLCFALFPLFAGDVGAAAMSSETLVGAGERAQKLTALAICAAAACAGSFLYARIMIKRPAVR